MGRGRQPRFDDEMALTEQIVISHTNASISASTGVLYPLHTVLGGSLGKSSTSLCGVARSQKGSRSWLRVGLRPKLLRRWMTRFAGHPPGCALAFGQSFCGVARSQMGSRSWRCNPSLGLEGLKFRITQGDEKMHRFELAGFFGALLAALTLSGVSFARPPFESAEPHHDPGAFIEENAEALNLDGETLSAIRSIVEASKGTGDQLHAKLRELHEGMKALLSQDTPDESAVMKQVDSIGVAEVEMHKHRLGTMLEIRALLTPEQREEMTRLREDSREHWKHALLEACEADLEALCPEAEDRWSRKQCLREQREKVSAACGDALKAAKRAHHGSHKGCSEHHKSGCSGNHKSGCSEHHKSGCSGNHESGCSEHHKSGCSEHHKSGCSEHRKSGDAY